MYKLIEKRQEDTAFKIFQSLPQNRIIDSNSLKGNFFIQMLIQLNAVGILILRILNDIAT